MAPKWRELADRFAEQIRNGEYAPGAQLPQIRDLVTAGEGSKDTVHKAYKALEAQGLVTSSRGHGTVVRQQTPLKRLGIARYDKAKWRDGDEVAFIADRVASGRAYRRNEQTQKVSRVMAPPLVAEAHGLPEGAEVYARARLVKEGSQPTHTLTSYYRPEHVEGTRIVDPTPGPMRPWWWLPCPVRRRIRDRPHEGGALRARSQRGGSPALAALTGGVGGGAAPHHVHRRRDCGGVRCRGPCGHALLVDLRLQGARFGEHGRRE